LLEISTISQKQGVAFYSNLITVKEVRNCGYIIDDSLSLRNFLCSFVTFWSSQGNLSSKKSRKTQENAKT